MKYAFDDAKKEAKKIVARALGVNEHLVDVELPPPDIEADIAVPFFKIAREKKQNPVALTTEASKKIRLEKSTFVKVEAIGAFLNFYIDWKKFNPLVFANYDKLKENYGCAVVGKGKTIVIDYSHPNIAKPFSIGHLRSTIIGQSLYNLFTFSGYKVIGDNHIGDWGTQFGKLLCAYKKWGKKAAIEKDPIKELLKLYVKFHEEAAKNSVLEDEARAWFKKLEGGDKEATALWKWFRELSLEEFNRLYDMLNIKFDNTLGESFYNDKLKSVVKEAFDKKIAEWAEAKEGENEVLIF